MWFLARNRVLQCNPHLEWGVSGISCPGRLLQVGNLARLPIFFMGFRLDLAFVGAEVEGPTRSVGGSSSDPTNAARGL